MLEVCVTGTGVVNSFGSEEIAHLKTLFPRINLRRMPLAVQMALLAAGLALPVNQIGQSESINQSCQSGLIIASAFTSVQMSFDFMDSIIENGPRLSSPTAFSHAVNNMLTGLLSANLNIQGPCHTISQFGLSFAGALNLAGCLLHARRAEQVLLGAVEEQDSRFEIVKNHLGMQNTGSGAVFFALSLQGSGPILALPCWEQPEDDATPSFELEGAYASIAQAKQLAELPAILQKQGLNQAWSLARQGHMQAAIRMRRV